MSDPSNKIRGLIPLPEDPADDPTEHELMQLAVESADQVAATRGMHAFGVRLVETIPGLFKDDGTRHQVLNEAGVPYAPRWAYFEAEGMAI